ncbi:WD40-repeat-containing domain protein [Boletus reticuloceps]|uniref:WD40-repeat-containing domain protein n=1 Tax=Boletus reticuloceps TaxID=495285 RepID=A0A8I2YMC7_9AGAM|nr:WD40-repeat-containing domain protein [Boletus reticuloceps]
MRAAKYSPTGDRIATATLESVRVWDSNDCRLLVDIDVTVIPCFNAGLVWFNNHLFVVTHNAIKQFDAATGSPVAEWPVPNSNGFSCISLPKHGKFIAHSTKSTITLWDTSTHSQLGLIQHPQDIRSIAFSPDDQSLAFSGKDGKISIIPVSRIIVSVVPLD